jgi:hypothetical protein
MIKRFFLETMVSVTSYGVTLEGDAQRKTTGLIFYKRTLWGLATTW